MLEGKGKRDDEERRGGERESEELTDGAYEETAAKMIAMMQRRMTKRKTGVKSLDLLYFLRWKNLRKREG